MSNLKITKKEEAKPASAEILANVEKKYGFIPNLMAVFADSPAALGAYVLLSDQVGKTAFSPEEQQAILIAASYENGCEYCVAAHSMVAVKMAGMSPEKLNAVRTGASLSDKKLDELVRFTKEIVSERGYVRKESLERFFAVGYTNQHALEVVLGVAMKTLSNYTNHIAKTPLDAPFSEFMWTRK